MTTQAVQKAVAGQVRVARTVAEVRSLVGAARRSGSSVGFVPTMGALHLGHRSLIEAARRQTDFVVVSIFVNPTQFGPQEDLSRYPRDLPADLELCATGGADVVFAPEVNEVYRTGTLETFVEVPGLGNVLEGACRPGHFRGVATVVLKLFNMVGPDVAFFGAKDYQQQILIRRMVLDLDVPVRIAVEPTVREPDGLAMSSRNRYLNSAERQAGTILHQAPNVARRAVDQGQRDCDQIRQILQSTIESEPLARIDSIDLVDAETLAGASTIEPGQKVVALLSVRVGPARLIDNASLVD